MQAIVIERTFFGIGTLRKVTGIILIVGAGLTQVFVLYCPI
jgi:hypothetical protein